MASQKIGPFSGIWKYNVNKKQKESLSSGTKFQTINNKEKCISFTFLRDFLDTVVIPQAVILCSSSSVIVL